jgi:type IV pilus assembly protein PilM
LNLSFLPKKKILSLDIGSYEIKVVEGKETKKGIIIDNYFTIPMPKGAYRNGKIVDKDLIHYVLKEKLKENKVKSKDTYLTINSSSILTRDVIIPKVDYEEIDDILKFQLEDYIPMNPESYIVQFKIIGHVYRKDIEKLNILLIAIPKDIVESHYKLLKDLELNPLVLDYQPNSMAKLIKYNGIINDNYATEDITFAGIDIGYDNTKVTIVKNGIIQVARIVEIGGKYIDQNILNFCEYNQEELEQMKKEIKNINQIEEEYSEHNRMINIMKNSFESLNEKIDIIFRYYLTREINNKINMILLFGGNANINGISNLFSNYFNIPSIKVESFNNLDFNGEISKYVNPIGSIFRTVEV